MKWSEWLSEIIAWLIGLALRSLIITPIAWIAWRGIAWDFNWSPLNFKTIFFAVYAVNLMFARKKG